MDRRFTLLRRTVTLAVALLAAAPLTASAATDPLLTSQWALSDPAETGAEEAWTKSSGAGVLVAVLDTGIQLDHPDLAQNIWTNRGEIAGNGIDDDRNGIVDDVHGANMFDLNANVADDHGHGTHVAGIVAARRGNGIGGSGIAPGATIMPVKVLDSTMSGNTDTLALGIRYAVKMGARIINASINGDASTEAVKTAVRFAGENGAIVVASAGNNGRNIDLLPSFPASISDPAIVSVAATSDGGSIWSGSNTGLRSVDIAAPGERIASTARGSTYSLRTGTSAAAPFVAGSLALLSAARPEMPIGALRDVLLETSRRSNLLASLLGGGRLDVGAAMHRVLPGAWNSAAGLTATAASAPGAPVLSLSSKSRARKGSKVVLRWSATGAERVTSWRVSLDGRVVATVPAGSEAVSRKIERVGSHRWRVVGFDADGAKIVSGRRAFKVISR